MIVEIHDQNEIISGARRYHALTVQPGRLFIKFKSDCFALYFLFDCFLSIRIWLAPETYRPAVPAQSPDALAGLEERDYEAVESAVSVLDLGLKVDDPDGVVVAAGQHELVVALGLQEAADANILYFSRVLEGLAIPYLAEGVARYVEVFFAEQESHWRERQDDIDFKQKSQIALNLVELDTRRPDDAQQFIFQMHIDHPFAVFAREVSDFDTSVVVVVELHQPVIVPDDQKNDVTVGLEPELAHLDHSDVLVGLLLDQVALAVGHASQLKDQD